jgi:drug/metabolite transporter (DMT)-like permease
LNKRAYLYVIASAMFFGLSAPLSKILVRGISPVALAGLLYLGAFLGLSIIALGRRRLAPKSAGGGSPLRKRDLVWLAGSILTGGILGPICLLIGLSKISGTAASLLLNLEGVATALIAVFVFRESAGRKIWIALGLMTCAGVVLSWDSGQGRFEIAGSLLVALAMACWGLDNNFTRNIADKDPLLIARIKGLVSGTVSLALAIGLGLRLPLDGSLLWGLLLGAFSYGLSLVLYIHALRHLGAFRAGAFFSLAPFIGAVVSLAILPEPARWVLLPGAAFMALGVVLLASENHEHHHRHERLVHTHAHVHGDGHHFHDHPGLLSAAEAHSHEHVHEESDHIHGHWPDIHHRHGHHTPDDDDRAGRPPLKETEP